MGYVASRKFCCCLPVRFGVFCHSLLGLAAGGVICVFGWLEVHKLVTKQLELESRQQIALWFISVAWSFTALISLMGLFGCLFKIRAFITSYAYTTTINTLVNIAIGIFFVWTLFHKDNSKESFLDKCDGNGDGDGVKVTHWFCQRGFDLIRVLIVIAFVIIWIFMLAGIFIVFDYVGQLHEEHGLEEEEEEKRHRPQQPVIVNVPSETAPVMRTTYDASPAMQGGWTSAKSPYVFNLPDNAYGNRR
ncbi:unnamed protein product [Somion occarium]|uniref:Uncharacterized protein n=1 Tax=Somion occarium TaxID=3059160 RepID=A0ABP1DTH3_9APHY